MRLDDQAVQLYRESRCAWLAGDELNATEFYAMLRLHHACDIYYEVELPEHVRLIHPVGVVLGRATYGDYFVAYNGSGVGSDLDGNRPVIGEGVVLFPGAKVLGKTKIGANVFVTANTVVQDGEVPDNSVVYPTWDNVNMQFCAAYKPTHRSVKKHFFPDAG